MSVDFRQRTPGELARIVWRRKWLIVLPTLAVAVAVAAVVWRLPDVYESTTLLTVRPATINTGIVPQLSESDLTIRINNITQEVTSRSTLEPMIENFNLYADERRRGTSMDELVERMRTKDIKITLNTSRNDITNGFFLAFRNSGRDDAWAARTAQAVTEALAAKYVSAQTKAASDASKLTDQFFSQKLEEARKNLDEIDKKRLDFMSQHLSSLPDSIQALVGQLAGLREEQKARIAEIGRLSDQIAANNKLAADLSKVDQQQVEEVIAQMTDPKSTAAYAELVKRKAELETEKQALLTQLTKKNPDVIAVQSQINTIQGQMDDMVAEHKRKVEEQRKRLEAQVDPRVTSYKAENDRLTGEVARQKSLLDKTESDIASLEGRINGVPTSEVGLQAIDRDYQSAKAVYDEMVAQQQKAATVADIAKQEQGESIAVIDPASLPEQPVAPRRPLLMLLGLFAGLACGVALAAAFEVPRLLTVQTAEDAEHYTGLPVLITLPVLMTPREERKQKARRVALAFAAVLATVVSAPALAFILNRLHLIELLANRG
jgi:polysaccharide chain length determinant protein (PEP-CTERM system associated)